MRIYSVFIQRTQSLFIHGTIVNGIKNVKRMRNSLVKNESHSLNAIFLLEAFKDFVMKSNYF